jgi:hypothetical protein
VGGQTNQSNIFFKIDPKHLPEDPQILQQMVLDLIAQLEREFTERGKI